VGPHGLQERVQEGDRQQRQGQQLAAEAGEGGDGGDGGGGAGVQVNDGAGHHCLGGLIVI